MRKTIVNDGKARASRSRIGLIDRRVIEDSLEVAAFALLPEDYTKRDVFRALMPRLYVMRQRGFGFRQITRLLCETGLDLTISSVRTYYYDLLTEMREECDQYWRKRVL